MNFRHLVSKTKDKISAFRKDDEAVVLFKFASAVLLQATIWTILFNIATYFNWVMVALLAYLIGTVCTCISLGFLTEMVCTYAVAPQRKFTVVQGSKS